MEFFFAQLIPLFGIFMIIAVVIGPIWIANTSWAGWKRTTPV